MPPNSSTPRRTSGCTWSTTTPLCRTVFSQGRRPQPGNRQETVVATEGTKAYNPVLTFLRSIAKGCRTVADLERVWLMTPPDEVANRAGGNEPGQAPVRLGWTPAPTATRPALLSAPPPLP